MTGMIRMTILLTERQMGRLRQAAEKRHTSVVAIVREAVDAAVPDSDEDRLTRQRRAFAAAGAFSSGHRDIAAHHDEALAVDRRW